MRPIKFSGLKKNFERLYPAMSEVWNIQIISGMAVITHNDDSTITLTKGDHWILVDGRIEKVITDK